MTISISSRDQTIINAHASGLLLKDIAPLVNMTTKGVKVACRRLGLEKRPKSKYSDEFIASIIAAYKGGIPYTKIGETHNLTRGQIAGILRRAGVMEKRPAPKPKVAKPKTNNTNRLIKEPKFRTVPFKERAAAVVPLNIPFADRKPNQCAYLYGDDPRTMTCCGHEAYGTMSWCLDHAMIVYRPADARDRAPRPR